MAYSLEVVHYAVANAPYLLTFLKAGHCVLHDVLAGYTLCDNEAFAQNTAALNKLASNMNRFSSVVNRFGIVPWAEQVTEIRVILEAQLGEG